MIKRMLQFSIFFILILNLATYANDFRGLNEAECEGKEQMLVSGYNPLAGFSNINVKIELKLKCRYKYVTKDYYLSPEINLNFSLKYRNIAAGYGHQVGGQEYLIITPFSIDFESNFVNLYDLLTGDEELFLSENTDLNHKKKFEILFVKIQIANDFNSAKLYIDSTSHQALGIPKWEINDLKVSTELKKYYSDFQSVLLQSPEKINTGGKVFVTN